MTTSIATEIANLLSDRNELVLEYDSNKVLAKKANYEYELNDGIVAVCAECKKVQWYQWEISHVCVHSTMEGKGYAKKIIKKCELKAIQNGGRIIQCTIRTNNSSSIGLFKNMGYKEVNSFYYPKSDNWVYVFQKCVSINQNTKS